MSTPSTNLVYDLPTRLFHWLFAGLFVTAYVIGTSMEHSPWFVYHMLAGLMLGALVILRVIWGLVGTRHARFSSFELNPLQLLAYFREMFTGEQRRWAGHNPASSWAALLMLALAAGLGITGYLMASGQGEQYEELEELHEVLANAFLGIALLHVAGVVLHVLRHRDQFPRSMVNGKKQDISETEAIKDARPMVAWLMVGVLAVWGIYLVQNLDPAAQQLTLFGSQLQLGDGGASESAEAGEHDSRAHISANDADD